MAKRTTQLILALGMGTIALLATLVILVNPATAADQCVHPTGAGSCLSSIQAAIDAAIGGDTIRVVQGTYNENVAITKDIVLEGGYQDQSLVTRDPDLYLTTINGGGVGVVISITNSADVTVDGFTITGGDGSNNVYLSGTNLDSGGGGIFIREATALISDNVISGNVGSRIANTTGLGGGILVISSTSPVRIYGNVIQANVAQLATLASSVPISVGVGGGIAIGDDSSAIIAGNQVLSNVALQANIPPQDTWGGAGGIAWWGDEITLDSNNVWYNVGNEAGGDGAGGGISLWGNEATLTNNTVAHNTAAVSGASANGGGISASGVQTLTLNGNWVMTNTALMIASSSATPQETWVGGGGISIDGYGTLNDSLVVQNNHIIGNVAVRTMTTSGADSRGHVDGGGLRTAGFSTTLILNNEVRGNTAVENLSLSGSGDWGGRPAGGGIYVSDSDNVTLSDNQIRNNVTAQQQAVNEVDSGSEAGGVALINLGTATVSNNTVSGNTAVVNGSITSNTGAGYYPSGGGIRVGCWDSPSCSLSFAGNDISNNTAAYTITVSGSDARGGASGGGLDADQVANLSLSGDTIRGNRALVFGSGSDVNGEGGGVRLGRVDVATIGGSGCTIEDNIAADMAQGGRGGGIRSRNSVLTLSDCDVKDNQALVSGDEGEGGGLFLDNDDDISNPTVTLTDNHIEGNVALGTGGSYGSGGGLRVRGVVNATLTGNSIISNVAAESVAVGGSGEWGGGNGGGVDIGGNDTYTPTVVMQDNVIADNTAAVAVTTSAGAHGGANGGGVRLNQAAEVTLIDNQVTGNVGLFSGTADGSGSEVFAQGGGLVLEEIPDATLQTNRVEDNVGAGSVTLSGGATNGGAGGGGINLWQTTALLQSNVISGNTSNLDGDGWGGGLNASESVLTMDANFILGNRMNPSYDGGSGGVWVWRSVLTSTNDVFARNYDAVGGGGDTSDSTLTLINDTLYDNGHTGVRVNDGSTAYVTNTIVDSHDNGLEKDTAATLIEDYNLLNNTTNYADGISPGSHTILDEDPLFVNAAADDFHLSSDSPAIDKGTSAGAPSVDFEGDPRPQEAGFDIGADEFRRPIIFLPIILKNATY